MIKSRMIWTGNAARREAITNTYKILASKSVGKIILVRPRRRREDNIKMDLK
jgi:hypothetical protein